MIGGRRELSVRAQRLKLIIVPAILVFALGVICTLAVQFALGAVAGGIVSLLEDEHRNFEKLARSAVDGLVAEKLQQSQSISSTRILLFDFASYGGTQSRTNNLSRLFAEHLRESESLIGIRWQHSESGQVFASGSAIDPEAFGWDGQQDRLQVYGPIQYNELESVLLVNKIVGVNG